MAEWLRRQIRIVSTICFPLGAQVQILLVSFSFPLKGGGPPVSVCPTSSGSVGRGLSCGGRKAVEVEKLSLLNDHRTQTDTACVHPSDVMANVLRRTSGLALLLRSPANYSAILLRSRSTDTDKRM